jgi:pilus assembly protein FimV
VDFDFGDLSLELDKPAEEVAAPAPATDDLDLGGADPLARKIELADEFRRIGDIEGARELLEEVIGKAEGALKTRAQTLLDELK